VIFLVLGISSKYPWRVRSRAARDDGSQPVHPNLAGLATRLTWGGSR